MTRKPIAKAPYGQQLADELTRAVATFTLDARVSAPATPTGRGLAGNASRPLLAA